MITVMSLSKPKPLNLLFFFTVIGKICLNQIADQENFQRTLLHCWWECKLVQPLWRTPWRFLKKLKLELPYDPEIPLLGIHPEKNMIRKDTCTRMFIAGLLTRAKTWKQPKFPSTEEWIKKMWHIYTVEYYSIIKKIEIMPFAATWMDLESHTE